MVRNLTEYAKWREFPCLEDPSMPLESAWWEALGDPGNNQIALYCRNKKCREPLHMYLVKSTATYEARVGRGVGVKRR